MYTVYLHGPFGKRAIMGDLTGCIRIYGDRWGCEVFRADDEPWKAKSAMGTRIAKGFRGSRPTGGW